MERGHLGRLVYIRKNGHLYSITDKEIWDTYIHGQVQHEWQAGRVGGKLGHL